MPNLLITYVISIGRDYGGGGGSRYGSSSYTGTAAEGGSLDRSYSSSSRPQRSASAVGRSTSDRYSSSDRHSSGGTRAGYGSDYGGSTLSVSSSYGAGAGTTTGYTGSRSVITLIIHRSVCQFMAMGRRTGWGSGLIL